MNLAVIPSCFICRTMTMLCGGDGTENNRLQDAVTPKHRRQARAHVLKRKALDAKLTFDDNALFRHADLRELRDITEEDPLEVEASKYNLNYIKLDGNVGCMVNGAGLAMATMDIIKYAGGMPANFLDVGGSASADQVAHAFEILLSDKSVRAVLINIFGGILRVDMLATGVVEAAKKTNIQLPVVLRLEGTNVQEGKKILMESGLNFTVAETMKDAADKVVAAAKQAA